VGSALAFGAVTAGLAAAALSGALAFACVLAYLAGTLAYSFALKRIPILDALALASLFTLRLGIGVAAAGVVLSPWLLTFSMFLFLSLSLAKRHTELARAAVMGSGRAGNRGYVAADRPMVLALGVGALVAGVLVFVLYLTQEAFAAAHLAEPRLLWLFPPALFLVAARVWLLSGRGELDDDPVAFVVRDRASLSVVAVLGLIFVAAWGGLAA
jgi:4-hydroxybenzoate polyprenyltransferase